MINSVNSGATNKIYIALRKLGTESEKHEEYSIPEIDDENLLAKDAGHRVVKHFISITENIDLLNVKSLTLNVHRVFDDYSQRPKLEEYQVYLKVKKAKKPNSAVKSNVPLKLLKEFQV